ncbi:hypothetical protein SMICM304S_09807 [Streptomyces microflavus]
MSSRLLPIQMIVDASAMPESSVAVIAIENFCFDLVPTASGLPPFATTERTLVSPCCSAAAADRAFAPFDASVGAEKA